MISEADIAAQVRTFLDENGWETYAEVQFAHGLGTFEGRADLVATRLDTTETEPHLSVVECKRELSFELFAQAARWQPFAHHVWIAFPYAKPSDGRREAFHIARDYYGFGILELQDRSGVVVRGHGNPNGNVCDHLLRSLRPEHKTYAAPGTNRGGQWSSFKETCGHLATHVAGNPGVKLEDAVVAIRHHYRNKASAVSSLRKEIKKGHVPDVFFGWRQGLYPNAVSAFGARAA